MAAIEVSGFVNAIFNQLPGIASVAVAVLLIHSSIKGFRFVRSLIGVGGLAGGGGAIPPAPGESSTVSSREDFHAMYGGGADFVDTAPMASSAEIGAMHSPMSSRDEFDAQHNPGF